MGTWGSPQAMIPTASVAPQCAPPTTPQKASAGENSEKIAAALTEVSRAPLVGTSSSFPS